jgi:hypothetical protein
MSYQDDGMVWHRERSSYADRQRLAHMRAQSDALLAARPELAGPYRVPPPAKVVAEAVAYVLPVPAESAAEKAKAFLLSELVIDAVPSLELQERAERAGVKWRTIRRVAKAVGVRVFRRGNGPWMWGLTADDRENDGQEPAASLAL